MTITEKQRAEMAELARRYGKPRSVDALIPDAFFDPIHRPDRVGEVCMVIRRPSGKILLAIKTFYPRGAYRLPTGGIGRDESIENALHRETAEETGLDTVIRRFLAAISYRGDSSSSDEPIFHTFAFLLDETGGTLESRDLHEQIEEYIEIEPSELRAVAERLARVTSSYSKEVGGRWSAWGEFRAVVHRAVADALRV